MNQSYIEVDPDFILENCEKIIDSIEKWRINTIRETYSKMIGMKVGFIFKKTLRTIEEAIKYDKSSQEFGCGSDEYWINLNAQNKVSSVLDLKKSAVIAKEENKKFYATVDVYSKFLKQLKECS